MIKIFISYRRDDSADFCGRLHDRLLEEFGEENVFRDIDDIKPGEKFSKIIADQIAACNVLIAVIGNNWTSATPGGKRRIDDDEDYVRAEISEALRRDKVIVPVLVQRANMPRRNELPQDISKLADRNAIEISDSRFKEDFERLLRAVGEERVVSLRKTFGVQPHGTLRFIAVILVCALGVAWLASERGSVERALALSWRAAKISLSSKHIPISAAADGHLRDAIEKLASSVRRDLETPGQPDSEPWPIAQAVVALKGTDELPETRDILFSFRELAEPECACWREFPTHYLPLPGAPAAPLRSEKSAQSAEKQGVNPLNVVATGWILLAQASLKEGAPDTLHWLVSEQDGDGGWAVFPVGKDKRLASIYGTCWALIGLKAHLSADFVPHEYMSTVKGAIERGTRWLLESQHKARWRFYPYLAQRTTDSESLSGLALHTLHEIANGEIGLKQIDRDWINELPEPPPTAEAYEGLMLAIHTKEGVGQDHFFQLKLPWLIIATVDAYPNGTLWERARAMDWLERAIVQPSVGDASSQHDNWWRSELLYALKYLHSRVSQ